MFNASVGLSEAELKLIIFALNDAAVVANSKNEKENLENILDLGFKLNAELNNILRLGA